MNKYSIKLIVVQILKVLIYCRYHNSRFASTYTYQGQMSDSNEVLHHNLLVQNNSTFTYLQVDISINRWKLFFSRW
jgi:hypothetical protein